MNAWLRQFGWLVAIVGMAVVPARAAEVSTEVSTRETYVGVPVVVRVTISNADQSEPPELPDIPDVTTRLPDAPQRSEQMTVINGQMNRRVTLSYDYQFTPRRPGRFTIPAMTVKADGKSYKTEPVQVVVSKSETGDLLLVELKGARKSLYVGESLEATLQIWVKPYTDQQFQIRLSEGDMWSLVDIQKCEWGLFQDVLQEMYSRRHRPVGKETLRKDGEGNDRAYYLYELTKTIWPQRPGQLDAGSIHILYTYPEQLGRDRSLFSMGNLTITRSRPLAAQVKADPIEIKPIPTAGRPVEYRGAVGQFQIAATAKPVDAAAGDPITLALTITGNGQMDHLQPPPLPELAELTRDFKVPTDPLAGEVQGNSKRFTQSIRAKSDTVQAIPSIPFAYFDPKQEKFVTIRTMPIPVRIRATEKLSTGQVVDSGITGGPVTNTLTEISGGLLANYTGAGDVLSRQDFSLGTPAIFMLALPPVLFAGCWLVQRHRRRLAENPSLSRRRSAKRVAMHAIESAGRENRAELASAVEIALCGYIADRCDLPAGGLTRAEAIEHLRQRSVSGTLIDEVDRLLERCEGMRYGAGEAGAEAIVADAAQQCIARLERERLA